MTRVEIEGGTRVVRVEGADRIWSLKSRLEIPLEHVLGAERDEAEARKAWHGIRAPGTSLPGVITAGTFYSHGERVFWDVHHPENAVGIRLDHEAFSRLVVEVEDPDAVVALINDAAGRGTGG